MNNGGMKIIKILRIHQKYFFHKLKCRVEGILKPLENDIMCCRNGSLTEFLYFVIVCKRRCLIFQ